jgi:hypothetical protein
MSRKGWRFESSQAHQPFRAQSGHFTGYERERFTSVYSAQKYEIACVYKVFLQVFRGFRSGTVPRRGLEPPRFLGRKIPRPVRAAKLLRISDFRRLCTDYECSSANSSGQERSGNERAGAWNDLRVDGRRPLLWDYFRVAHDTGRICGYKWTFVTHRLATQTFHFRIQPSPIVEPHVCGVTSRANSCNVLI